MANYRIMTDSNADLTPELVQELDVRVISTEYTVGGETYLNYPDHREHDFHTFYEKLRAGAPASTALINIERYTEFMRETLAAGEDLLYICFSSGLSGSYGCAVAAVQDLTEEFPDRTVLVVDSRAASGGEALLVYNAVMRKNDGMAIDVLAKWVEDNRDHLCHWFTVDDLDHLKRGGRVSAVAAAFGGMLSIKPVMHVDNDGHLIPVAKVRGRRAALDALVAEMEKTVTEPENQLVYLCHADCEADTDYVVEQIKAKMPVKDIRKGHIGPVIGCHAGPGTVALFFVGSHK